MDTTEIEDALLYHAMWGSAREVFTLVSVEDFTPGDRQELAAICDRMAAEHESIDAMMVNAEAQRLGSPSTVFISHVMTSGFTGTPRYYGARLREASIRRQAEAAMSRGLNRLQQGSSTDEVIEALRGEFDALPVQAVSDDDTWTLDDIMGLQQQDRKFTVPGLLAANERLVLTGTEGGGKSVFIYQMLTAAAFGVDSFTLETVEPQRVLFLDVENDEFQAREALDRVVPALRELSGGVAPEWRSMRRRVVDLMATRDRADVIRRVLHYAPDILYMGTAYKLTDVSEDTHRSVRAIQSVVERIRAEIGCTTIIEHHAGHGHMNDRNGMRPEGSSHWLRWPEFGYGMKPMATNNGQRLMRLMPWRGDRASGREFPAALKQGSVMPWVPIYADEWEASYSYLDS